MDRAPGLSVRLKLTLSYAGFLMLAGSLMLAAAWVFLLRHGPDGAANFVPNRNVFLLQGYGPLAFVPAAATVLVVCV